MIQELIYTSVPRGLAAGAKGFCVVAATRNLPAHLSRLLESLSGYRPVPGSGAQPVAWSHVEAELGGQTYRILSRVADYGLDYSQRTNKLAHHIAVSGETPSSAGPAWTLRQNGLLESTWQGEPRLLAPRSLPNGSLQPGPCRTWESVAGDAGWAGMLAQTVLDGHDAWIVIPETADALSMVLEATALLPPDRRWEATFTTYFLSHPPTVRCRWKFVIAGSPEVGKVRRSSTMIAIDLTRGETPPDLPAVRAARAGQAIAGPRPSAPSPQSIVSTSATPATERRTKPVIDPAGSALDDLDLDGEPRLGPPQLPSRRRRAATNELPPIAPPKPPGRRSKTRWILASVVLAALLVGTIVATYLNTRTHLSEGVQEYVQTLPDKHSQEQESPASQNREEPSAIDELKRIVSGLESVVDHESAWPNDLNRISELLERVDSNGEGQRNEGGAPLEERTKTAVAGAIAKLIANPVVAGSPDEVRGLSRDELEEWRRTIGSIQEKIDRLGPLADESSSRMIEERRLLLEDASKLRTWTLEYVANGARDGVSPVQFVTSQEVTRKEAVDALRERLVSLDGRMAKVDICHIEDDNRIQAVIGDGSDSMFVVQDGGLAFSIAAKSVRAKLDKYGGVASYSFPFKFVATKYELWVESGRGGEFEKRWRKVEVHPPQSNGSRFVNTRAVIPVISDAYIDFAVESLIAPVDVDKAAARAALFAIVSDEFEVDAARPDFDGDRFSFGGSPYFVESPGEFVFEGGHNARWLRYEEVSSGSFPASQSGGAESGPGFSVASAEDAEKANGSDAVVRTYIRVSIPRDSLPNRHGVRRQVLAWMISRWRGRMSHQVDEVVAATARHAEAISAAERRLAALKMMPGSVDARMEIDAVSKQKIQEAELLELSMQQHRRINLEMAAVLVQTVDPLSELAKDFKVPDGDDSEPAKRSEELFELGQGIESALLDQGPGFLFPKRFGIQTPDVPGVTFVIDCVVEPASN